MENNFNEEYIVELIKKELRKVLSSNSGELEAKKDICFLGENEEIREFLSQKFNFIEEAHTVIVSQLSLKNLFNISNAVYDDSYEEKIIKALLNNKEIVIIKEGIEFSKYENIPTLLLKKYESYISQIKSYGIKVETKDFYLNSILKKEEVFNSKLLDLANLKKLEEKGIRKVVLDNTIVTSSAMEYAKEKNIEISKR